MYRKQELSPISPEKFVLPSEVQLDENNPYLKVDPQSLQVVSSYRKPITSGLDKKLTKQTFPEIGKYSRS